jgi:hypothetical protein
MSVNRTREGGPRSLPSSQASQVLSRVRMNSGRHES